MSKSEDYVPLRRSFGGVESAEEQALFEAYLRQNERTANWICITFLNIFLFMISLIVLGFSWHASHQDMNYHLKQVTAFSPLYDRMKMHPLDRTVNGSLFNEAQDLLRNDPSPEVDKAWKKLAKTETVLISEKEVLELGKDPETRLQVPQSWDTRDKTYAVQLDGQHNIHCLNAIRKYAYREYYYPDYYNAPGDRTSPLTSLHQAHLSHCVSVLLQTLTCEPSLDIITYKWMELQENPFPDFNVNKKCRDHSQILEWQDQHKLNDDQLDELIAAGPGQKKITEAPPLLRDWVMKGGRTQDELRHS